MAMSREQFRRWLGEPRPPCNRRFGGTPNKILGTRIETATIAAMDEVIKNGLHLPDNRSEFVRRAIEEKLARMSERAENQATENSG